MRILLADDEEDLTRAIGTILTFSGYDVDVVNNGEDAVNFAISNYYDILILDVMMPNKSGIEVTRELRNKNIDVPVLMLTAKSQVEDKVEGLDAGANDYLTKPFDRDELLARIRAITRATQNNVKKIKIGNITLNRDSKKLCSEKASFNLNSEECKLLEILANNENKIWKKIDLMSRIWSDEENNEIVPMYVSFLQNKLKALGADFKIEENNENGYFIKYHV